MKQPPDPFRHGIQPSPFQSIPMPSWEPGWGRGVRQPLTWEYNFDEGPNTATYSTKLKTDVEEMTRRMVALEEEATRKFVVAKLRELGYVVIEPKGEE